jgi:hypothetical protein
MNKAMDHAKVGETMARGLGKAVGDGKKLIAR